MPKSRAQFTPMRTTPADSRTKIIITLDTLSRPNPLYDKETVLVSSRPLHRVSSVITRFSFIQLSPATVRTSRLAVRQLAMVHTKQVENGL
jgi:hypothetical protein